MQLAHAGRKASTYRPWSGHGKIPESSGGWSNVVAPSALAFADDYPMPQALSIDDIRHIVSAFAAAARRACEAEFRVIEIHAAHGYLIHEFLSPLNNQRTDSYGGSFENRTRMLREIVTAVRGSWPERAPLFVRISATDWIDDGWDIQQSVELARQLTDLGDDLIDCSSGGNVAHEKIPAGPVVKRRLQSRCAGKPTSSRVRTGGRRHHRPRPSARSLLALACGSRARPANFVAGPISQSGLK